MDRSTVRTLVDANHVDEQGKFDFLKVVHVLYSDFEGEDEFLISLQVAEGDEHFITLSFDRRELLMALSDAQIAPQ